MEMQKGIFTFRLSSIDLILHKIYVTGMLEANGARGNFEANNVVENWSHHRLCAEFKR